MQSTAPTVAEYLKALPEERRNVIAAVRQVILNNLDADFEEGMQYGMIGYAVPHRVYPPGYHCDPKQPLPFAGLASQKNHMSVHFMCLYGDDTREAQFRKAWEKTGRKLDMGRCCIRFKKLEDIALDVIADLVRGISAKGYIARYEELLSRRAGSAAARKPAKAKAKAKVAATGKGKVKAAGSGKGKSTAAASKRPAAAKVKSTKAKSAKAGPVRSSRRA